MNIRNFITLSVVALLSMNVSAPAKAEGCVNARQQIGALQGINAAIRDALNNPFTYLTLPPLLQEYRRIADAEICVGGNKDSSAGKL